MDRGQAGRDQAYRGRKVSMELDLLEEFEFDQEFEQLMSANIERLEGKETKQGVGHRIARPILLFLGKFCNVEIDGRRRDAAEATAAAAAKATATESTLLGALEQIISPLNLDFSQKIQNHGQSTQTERERQQERGRWQAWTALSMIVFLFCTTRMTTRIYFQYIYDLHVLRRNRFRGNATMRLQHDRRVSEAEASLDAIGAPYRRLTFAIEFFELFIVICALVLYVHTQLFFGYYHQFDFSIIRCLLDFPRELKHCNTIVRREMNRFIGSSRNYAQLSLQLNASPARLHELSVGELARFVEEHEAQVDKIRLAPGAQSRFGIDNQARPKLELELPAARGPVLEHLNSIKMIETMALDGSLVPQNRNAAWIDQLTRYSPILIVLYMIGSSFAQLMELLGMQYFGRVELSSSPMDLLAMAEMSLLTLQVCTIAIFYCTVILTTCVDQVHLIEHLKRSIKATIAINEQRYYSSLRLIRLINEMGDGCWGGGTKLMAARRKLATTSKRKVAMIRWGSLLVSSSYAQMDADVLKAMLQYKIYVAQYEPVKRCFGFSMLVAGILMVLLPLIGRLHVPYIDPSMKVLVGLLNLVCVLVANLVIMIPISYLYSRATELYNQLSCLMAHTVAISAHQRRPNSPGAPDLNWPAPDRFKRESWAKDSDIEADDVLSDDEQPHRSEPRRLGSWHRVYKGHAIWLLRKELDHPDGLAVNFMTNVFGVQLNYGNLLKVNFWIGLLLQSTLFDITALNRQHELVGSILMDPLGLF